MKVCVHSINNKRTIASTDPRYYQCKRCNRSMQC